jgi:hypothetical protein
MIFRSELRDALWVNWALPLSTLPELPPPLVADTLGRGADEVGFASLVLIHHVGLRSAAFPWPRLSFPQCNLRLLARDEERVASVYFLRELMPAWAVPIARGVGRLPASAAIIDTTSADPCEQRWSIVAGQKLALIARPGAAPPAAPLPGNWPETVAFFRERPRGYVGAGRSLRRLTAEHPGAAGVPMRVELLDTSWLEARLPQVPAEVFRQPHSSFLIPSIQLTFAVESDLEARPAEELSPTGRPAVT